MKRVLPILVLCVALFTLSGVGALAQGPDTTTPPVVYAFGVSASTMSTVGCPGNTAVMVQVKAYDVNGIPEVDLEIKRPGDLVWTEQEMQLKADGYWRAWIPKTAFTVEGIWKLRVEAYDGYGNETTAGPKSLTVATCVVDVTPPTINGIEEIPEEAYVLSCSAELPKTVIIQANVWDMSGVDRVAVRYLAPGAIGWVVAPMPRFVGNTYRATLGPFYTPGDVQFRVQAWDKFGNKGASTLDSFELLACP